MRMRIVGIVLGAGTVIVTIVMGIALCSLAFGMRLGDDVVLPLLPNGGLVILALSALIGGLGGGYIAIRVGAWRTAGWIVLAIGVIDAVVTARLFTNAWVVFLGLTAFQVMGIVQARRQGLVYRL